MDLILAIALMVVFALVGAGGGYFYRKNMAEKRIGRTEEYAKKLLDDATRKAAETKKEMEIEAKEEVLRLKTKLDDEIRTRRAEMQRSERRVNQREEMLDKKMDNLEKREEAINQKSEQTQALYDEAEQLRDKQVKELERIAGMTQDEAEQMIIEPRTEGSLSRRRRHGARYRGQAPRTRAKRRPATSSPWPSRSAPPTMWPKPRCPSLTCPTTI